MKKLTYKNIMIALLGAIGILVLAHLSEVVSSPEQFIEAGRVSYIYGAFGIVLGGIVLWIGILLASTKTTSIEKGVKTCKPNVSQKSPHSPSPTESSKKIDAEIHPIDILGKHSAIRS